MSFASASSPERQALRAAGWDRCVHLILDLEETVFMRPMTTKESEQRALLQKEIDQLLDSLYWAVPGDERPRTALRRWKDETGTVHMKVDRSMLCDEDRVQRSLRSRL